MPSDLSRNDETESEGDSVTELAELWAERDRYREALERIAGPVDRPFLGVHGKIAADALCREAATPEAIAERAKRDYDHYVSGISLLKPSVKGSRDD